MAIPSLFQKLLNTSQGRAIIAQMYNSLGSEAQSNFLNRDTVAPSFDAAIKGDFGSKEALKQFTNRPKSQAGGLVSEIIGSGQTPANFLGYASDAKDLPKDLASAKTIGLGDVGNLAFGAVKAHPFKSAGLGLLGAGNIGGLTDNDKFGGQLGGLALGGLGSAMAGLNPYAAAMLTLGGGELGALFDKLRANKEQQQQPYYGGR